MDERHVSKIATELGLAARQVQATAELIIEGAAVPFIARYRKEATGSLDEVQITAIRDRLDQLAELDKRRDAILKSLQERELLTDDLKEKILTAETLSVLEDIYLPFRPKRRTRATVARERGLEPLAHILYAQEEKDPATEAAPFIDPEKSISSVEEALAGARDIIAEWISEDQAARAALRVLFASRGVLRTKVSIGKEAEGNKYRDYFEWEEPVPQAPSHRILAMRRGEKEGFLNLTVLPPEPETLSILECLFVKGNNACSDQVHLAMRDSYTRLLSPSMETEIRLDTKKRADEEAIRIFAGNLRQLLMAPPLGQKNVLAIDPGLRTGCKTVCLDRQGKLLHNETIFPLLSEKGREESARRVLELCGEFQIEAVAVGNGTGGRETEAFIRSLPLPGGIPVILVNESGASVYSASKAAREEFPDHDVTVRGAISIGRRLMDPLAELVKIDPKSIGVGQYQHDVDQPALKRSLDDVVASCVNAVGVEVNTASAQLLTYVSGLGPQLAANILVYRNENGPFSSREDLKKVPRLGPKAFEQAAGFLRIRGGKNPLDAGAVHPESYPVVQAMAADLGCTVEDLMCDEMLRKQIDPSRYVTEKTGLPTLNDILKELAKPGRDPRQEFESFRFAEGIEKIEDLKPGMKLDGIVTNVTAFGAFVDIGVHQDGLVHVSQLSDHFVKDPNQVVKVQQKIKVTVLSVDLERKRISLSLKKKPGKKEGESRPGEKAPMGKPSAAKKKGENGPFNNPFAKVFRREE
ncbi:MAG: Tex family protein [Deltaproteobacteria bacterium]|nr:Tex family protein [Deltaproteobacteria bacterium]